MTDFIGTTAIYTYLTKNGISITKKRVAAECWHLYNHHIIHADHASCFFLEGKTAEEDTLWDPGFKEWLSHRYNLPCTIPISDFLPLSEIATPKHFPSLKGKYGDKSPADSPQDVLERCLKAQKTLLEKNDIGVAHLDFLTGFTGLDWMFHIKVITEAKRQATEGTKYPQRLEVQAPFV